MSDSARLYAYKALFEAKRLVTRADMMEVAEVSLATFKRDIAKLRDQMGMPILFDKDRGGYYLDRNNLATEMPGLWFNPEELVALLTIQRLIEQLEPGLVGLKLRPLQKKLTHLLEAKGLGEAEIAKRVRMTFAGKRQLEFKAFEQVALATISRKQVKVTHLNRERAERVERTISPQELVHYRDNWYINAWCHLRKGIRSFGLDAIEDVQILDAPAQEVDTAELRRITQASYGIFTGQATAWALLRFSSHRAQWVEAEQWHAQQMTAKQPDGSYLLKVPYSDDRELMGDILSYGADVQVLEPKELRAKVQLTLLAAAAKYV